MLEIMTPERKDIDILPGFVSLQYSDMFDTVGTFDLWCAVSNRNCNLLKEYNLINFDGGLAGEIEYIEKSRQTQKVLLHAQGKMLSGLLDTKIIWGLYTDYNKPEDIMANIVTSQCITPSDTARKLIGLTMGTKPNTENIKINYQNTGGEIIDSLTKLAQPYGLGYEVFFDYCAEVPSMTFNVLKGTDRSVDQNTVDEIVFSISNGNISGSTYVKNALNVKNVALVAGAGEGAARIYSVVSAFSGLTGTRRRELFVDARDLQQKDETGAEIGEAAYLNMLQERGKEKLQQYMPIETFSVDLVDNNLYVPGKDFYKGDIVTIQDEEMGVQANVMVKGFQKTYDESGAEKIAVILGDLQPRTIDIVKRRENI